MGIKKESTGPPIRLCSQKRVSAFILSRRFCGVMVDAIKKRPNPIKRYPSKIEFSITQIKQVAQGELSKLWQVLSRFSGTSIPTTFDEYHE